MQVITFKARPKTLFGIVLALTGVIVIVLSFTSNHLGKEVNGKKQVSCATAEERAAYLSTLGYTFEEPPEEKEITIPEEFSQVYADYNDIQKQQGFDLSRYKGETATIYKYHITNYKDDEHIIADLLVKDGILIGADLCNPDAENGFLIALGKNDATN